MDASARLSEGIKNKSSFADSCLNQVLSFSRQQSCSELTKFYFLNTNSMLVNKCKLIENIQSPLALIVVSYFYPNSLRKT